MEEFPVRFLSPQAFLGRFCRVAESPPRTLQAADFSGVPCGLGVSEEGMYLPLVTELNKHCSPCQFHISPLDGREDEVDGVQTVRPVLWLKDHTPRRVDGSRNFRTSTIARRVSATCSASAPFDWGRCELTCDVKPSIRDDPFAADDPDLYEENTDVSMDSDSSAPSSTAQAIAYFMAQASRQPRTFVLQLFIFGSHARLVRWDRCRAIVSHRFDYRASPRPLADFVWRYSRLERASGRGWDTSVALASCTSAEILEDAVHRVLLMPPLESSSGTEKTIYRALSTTSIAQRTLSGDYPTYSVRIASGPDKWDIETTLLIRRPFFEHPDPFGRATRAYLAYDVKHAEFRFFKDTWRRAQPLPGCLSEEAFYTLAESFDDPDAHLPTVFFAGDVVGAEGDVQSTAEMYGDRRVHCCVLQELLCPLRSFDNSYELTWVILDVVKTMKAVHDASGILQSDISETNVMFRVNDAGDAEGVLNDWDNNRPAHTGSGTQQPLQIIGTWEYTAIELHDSTTAQRALRYDLEATVLWVFLSTALTHLLHTPTRDWHLNMFGRCTSIGVLLKRRFLQDPASLPIFSNAPELTMLVRNICAEYSAYYAALAAGARDEVERTRARVSDVALFVRMFEDALNGNRWPVRDRIAEPDKMSPL